MHELMKLWLAVQTDYVFMLAILIALILVVLLIRKGKQWVMENKWARVTILALGAIIGWVMLKHGIPDYLLPDHQKKDGIAPLYFGQFVATIPVLFLLWVFRTYDARQQIAKADAQVAKTKEQIERTDAQIKKVETQIQQRYFAQGMEYVKSKNALDIKVGVKILMNLSKRTNQFDSLIELIFFERLEHLPEEAKLREDAISINSSAIFYTRDILKWCSEKLDQPSMLKLKFRYKELPPMSKDQEKDGSFSYPIILDHDQIKKALDFKNGFF